MDTPESRRKENKKYYLKTRDSQLARSKKHYREHRLKKIEYAKEYRLKNAHLLRAYYLNNRDKILSKSRKRQQDRRDINFGWLLSFWKIKKFVCSRCGYNKSFSAIQFHHLDPSQKKDSEDTVARWSSFYSLEKFKDKIKSHSFIILCANCHAELHAKEWTINE